MPDQSPFPCPHCGKSFLLTESYLAQFGGQELVCDRCNGAMTLPRSLAQLEALPSQQAPELPETPQTARLAPTLSYAAPPLPSATRDGIWRDGMAVVKIRGPKLPRRCRICGEAVSSMQFFTMTWNPGVKLGLGHKLATDAFAETVTIGYGHCREHAPWIRPSTVRLIRWISLPVIFALLIAFTVAADERSILKWPFAIGLCAAIVLLLASLVVGNHPISLIRIERDIIWLAGFGEGYLAHLPSLREHEQAPSSPLAPPREPPAAP